MSFNSELCVAMALTESLFGNSVPLGTHLDLDGFCPRDSNIEFAGDDSYYTRCIINGDQWQKDIFFDSPTAENREEEYLSFYPKKPDHNHKQFDPSVNQFKTLDTLNLKSLRSEKELIITS